MAESIVSDIVVRILEHLGKSAVEKIAPYFGGEKKLKRFQQTMLFIQARLSDAERLREGEESALVKVWLKELKHVFYRLEDLFEEVAMADDRKDEMAARKLCKLVCFCISKLDRLKMNKMVTQDVESIMSDLEGLRSNMDQLHLRVEQRAFDPIIGRETHSFVREEEVIGRDEDKNKIVRMLLAQDDDAGEAVSVIPIVGIGGLGKTTLAQLAYNDTNVQRHFELKRWACISEISSFKELAGKVLQSIIGEDCQKWNIEKIQSRLHEAVDDKMYLLVLDDVWDENRERWHSLRSFLCGGKQGSKIIVTSRSKVVASNMGTVEPYELEGLTEEKSWVLFKRLAFRQGQEEKNSNLSSIGREIVKKCVNVPLAIRTIAGILYSKDTVEEWVHFEDTEIRILEQNENKIMSTLKLSYDHLAPQLKQCFAYCCLFPKDYEFEKERLIWLWMSQGFVQPSSQNQNQSLNDVGHRYFMELVRRCFFQDVERNEVGRIVRCKMHDLMHDLASFVGDECLLVDECRDLVPDNNIRHVRFQKGEIDGSEWRGASWLVASQQIRSFLCNSESSCSYFGTNMKKMFLRMRYLRALDLGEGNDGKLPDSIGELKHLRYLRTGWIESGLPNGITRLHNLQTLDIKLDRYAPPIEMPGRMGKLKSLEVLSYFVVGENNGLDALGSMNLVGKLKVYFKKPRGKMIDEGRAAKLKGKKLTSLSFSWEYDEESSGKADEEDELLRCLQPPPTLEYLNIDGWRGVRFPSWGMDEFPCLLPNLVKIIIEECSKCKYLPNFSRLSHLKELVIGILCELEYIEEEEEEEEGEGSAATLPYFPSLEKLTLHWLKQVKGWSRSRSRSRSRKEHHHSLPLRLTYVDIRDCPELKTVPLLSTSIESLWIENCNKLELWDDEDDDDVNPWQPLKNLRKLEIWNISILETLPEGLSCLTMLQELQLRKMENLKAVPEWIGQLTHLRKLIIHGCTKLSELPESIGSLTQLQTLCVSGCSEELKRRYEKPNGEAYPLLQHIPTVYFI